MAIIKLILGLIVAFLVGLTCRLLNLPSPAPPVLTGAFIVMAMSMGYYLLDRFLAARSVKKNRDPGAHQLGEEK